ncbi:hypothetical protein CTI18_04525 [Prevotella intermedia]|uniref:Uncharacterized protein n=1 Tax=Prevotella intermedia TaxID=28131 RepID=A0A2G8IAW9_PREIN|nr:hypothetical protein CTI18_04525 [Prevotella intermedia]
MQNLLFCIPKAAVLHGKSVGFALQNSRFRNAKSKLSFFVGIIFTKRKGFLRKSTLNEWEKIALLRLLLNGFFAIFQRKVCGGKICVGGSKGVCIFYPIDVRLRKFYVSLQNE